VTRGCAIRRAAHKYGPGGGAASFEGGIPIRDVFSADVQKTRKVSFAGECAAEYQFTIEGVTIIRRNVALYVKANTRGMKHRRRLLRKPLFRVQIVALIRKGARDLC